MTFAIASHNEMIDDSDRGNTAATRADRCARRRDHPARRRTCPPFAAYPDGSYERRGPPGRLRRERVVLDSYRNALGPDGPLLGDAILRVCRGVRAITHSTSDPIRA